jgi:hypothetical protein
MTAAATAMAPADGGVGCNLEVHVQDNRIVKVTSPFDHDVGHGHLCAKGDSASSSPSAGPASPEGFRGSATAALESQGADFPDEGGCQPSWGQR